MGQTTLIFTFTESTLNATRNAFGVKQQQQEQFHYRHDFGILSILWNSSEIPIGIILLSTVLALYLRSICRFKFCSDETPVVGTLSVYEPQMFISWRFFRNASKVLNDGYASFPKNIWTISRADTEMLILPPKYVPELRSLPIKIASPTAAHSFNLAGKHTNMNIILKNNLHFRTLQERLTPNLSKLIRPMQDELEYAMQQELPACENEWVDIKPYHVILRLVARISARTFLGLPLCRSAEWLEISTQFTENTFISLVVLRVLPRFLHGVTSWCLPSVWKANNYIRRAKKLLGPEIKRRQADARAGRSAKENNTLLSWMIEIASEAESNPNDLAHLEVVISLASIHTSHMNAVHVLYDLAAHPEYIEILRNEIDQVVAEDGPLETWSKSTFYKLKRLDSFMRESQRHNPPTLLSYHRIMLQDHILTDGTVLSRGSHIAMPVNAIQNAVTQNPDDFDPFRYYRMRLDEGQSHLHQFATTEPNVLNFGHGKYACPGRFFAALEIKIILVKLLMEYDWKLSGSFRRPKNLSAHEFVFPNQDGDLKMRKRAHRKTVET